MVDISVHRHDMFSAYSMGSHIVYICCVEFQAFKQINSSIFNILTNVQFATRFVILTIIRQTFQYMDMTCSVLTVWDPYCLHSEDLHRDIFLQ